MPEGGGRINIVLVRHAYAGLADPEKWPDDEARPVTPKGAQRFVKAAKGLANAVRPEKVLTSGAKRTWQTAKLLTHYGGWPEPERSVLLEHGSDMRDAAAEIDRLQGEGIGNVGIVGHEPLLSALISYLLTGEVTDVTTKLKKGGAAWIVYNGKPGDAHLMWVMPRKALANLRNP